MNLSRLNAREIEIQAQAVELQLKKLAHRSRPTPSERQLTAELKKLRLAMKDRLGALQVGLRPSLREAPRDATGPA